MEERDNNRQQPVLCSYKSVTGFHVNGEEGSKEASDDVRQHVNIGGIMKIIPSNRHTVLAPPPQDPNSSSLRWAALLALQKH